MTVIIFLVFIVERLFMTSFADAGILPRTVSGLKGIFFGPLIHGDWSHLISNLSAFPVLLAMLTLVYRRNYVRIFAALYVMTGLLVWLFARPAYHIGVSGVIYALASFLFFGGIMASSKNLGTNLGTNLDTDLGTAETESETKSQLLEFCSEPRSKAEIQEQLGIKSKRYVRQILINSLLESGELMRTIPDKPNSPKQRYVRKK